LLGKISTCHSSSEDDTNIDKDKMFNENNGSKKKIDVLKQESKLLTDGVLEKISESYLEARENESVEEVSFY